MASTTPATPAASASSSSSSLLAADSGLWVGVALFGGIMLSGTRVAPLVAGLLGVALIVQLQGLLSGG